MMIRANGTGVLYPADRCTWTLTYDNSTQQYDINTAIFYTGAGSATAAHTIDLGSDVTLGYIGKSGRFVGITEE